jgi:hypothetical protein
VGSTPKPQPPPLKQTRSLRLKNAFEKILNFFYFKLICF